MAYVTYAVNGSYTDEQGFTRQEAIEALLNGVQPDSKSKHTRGFFRTRTIITNNPRSVLPPALPLLGAANLWTSEDIDAKYTTFNIPKKAGGYREIDAPSDDLKLVQRAILSWLTNSVKMLPHDCSYAYSRGRCAYDSLVTHQHRNARWFLKLDIKDFFPSITEELLREVLPTLYPMCYVPPTDMDILIKFAVKQGHLPQGSCLSPILSNLIMVPFDHAINKKLFAFKNSNYTYTRYADDILITCAYDFNTDEIVAAVEETLRVLHLPFQLKHEKTRYGSMCGRNWNLGLMYNKDQQITVGHKRKRRLHSMTMEFVTNSLAGERWSTKAIQELRGNLAYLESVEPEYYETFEAKYSNVAGMPLPSLFKRELNERYI